MIIDDMRNNEISEEAKLYIYEYQDVFNEKYGLLINRYRRFCELRRW